MIFAMTKYVQRITIYNHINVFCVHINYVAYMILLCLNDDMILLCSNYISVCN